MENKRIEMLINVGIVLIICLVIVIWNFDLNGNDNSDDKMAIINMGGREVSIWPFQFNYLNTDEKNQLEATALVNETQEVKDWLASLKEYDNPDIESRPIVEFDHMWGDIYVVHAYEWIKDSGDNAHAATLNWFDVDLASKTIRAEFE